MGGDCLNTGCVPSKALIAAARRAHDLRTGAPLGIASVEPTVDFAAVHAHVHRAIATIAPVDSVEHMTELGCEVIRGDGFLTDRSHVAVGDRKLSAPRIVLAVGSRPDRRRAGAGVPTARQPGHGDRAGTSDADG